MASTPVAPAATLNRRALPKSKAGCVTCKQRRVKCDETRPSCERCNIGGREAGLGSQASGRFDAFHMALFYHAVLNMASYMALDGDMAPIIECALDNAVTAPYLLDQMLAVAALHHSVVDRANSRAYHHHATSLQNRALGQFNDASDKLTDPNIIPSFLFATFLGYHVLRNTLADHQGSISSFVGAFVDYLHVHRGTRVVTRQHWPQIEKSSLAPLLEISSIGKAIDNRQPGPETQTLLAHLQAQPDHASSSSTAACIDALLWAQWVLNIQKRKPPRFSVKVHAATAWPLVVPDEFVSALYQRRPEALAVLAHYLAILHVTREFWVFEPCEFGMIQALADHVGPFWEKALQWPLSCKSG
ncbi:hypothetical protein Micbo1qcDRAFT_187302 [Microdochium bolleyi]|uniref:Zn(2)-C6 fungal-type domain-containing protein n=1 Tax=Microdochium bolleyi TaxID=196109 RepID=A0A136JKA5_9PEZI|nr:hypothetical protein Micbo1qcDRAFT_187302 [Microdochium bolleyi]